MELFIYLDQNSKFLVLFDSLKFVLILLQNKLIFKTSRWNRNSNPPPLQKTFKNKKKRKKPKEKNWKKIWNILMLGFSKMKHVSWSSSSVKLTWFLPNLIMRFCGSSIKIHDLITPELPVLGRSPALGPWCYVDTLSTRDLGAARVPLPTSWRPSSSESQCALSSKVLTGKSQCKSHY